jgi:quinol-cytochrome oxidoreductase complex cytochrome b subunit
MRVETIPLIVGGVVGLVGLAILADAWLPESMPDGSERRRRERTERSIGGEASIGVAILCFAAAIVGRDTWPYTTVAVIAGAVLFLFGVIGNRKFLRDRIVNRGALRRGGLADRERSERAKKQR